MFLEKIMKIEHIAIWTRNIEELKLFYEKYFNAKSAQKYINKNKQFESYFLKFDSGARLELMSMTSIPETKNDVFVQFTGLIHIAISTGAKERVDALTRQLKNDGFQILDAPRITGDGYYESIVLDPDGNRIEDSKKIAQILENAGADCIDVTQGIILRSPFGITIPSYCKPGCFIHLAEEIKKHVNIPVMGVGGVNDPRMAARFIEEEKCDIINMGRQLICDAETPNKYFNGQLDDIRYCIGCLQSCVSVCVQDAYSGQNYKEITNSTDPKKIVILGAGIAGLEAARVAKLRGHDVEIYEKSNKIGGIMPLVAAEYKKEEFINIVKYLEIQLKKLKRAK